MVLEAIRIGSCRLQLTASCGLWLWALRMAKATWILPGSIPATAQLAKRMALCDAIAL